MGAGEVVIHIAGDSTAAIFPASDPRVGWGAVFQAKLAPPVKVDDRALSGRSTKSFIDEGAWASLIAGVRAGDYVFIGFGHNDEKSEDPKRYTDPATTFADNLKRFVGETRAAGAAPVLLTPISRRKFSGATITASHGAYPDAVKAVATATATPLVDLTERTKSWLEGLGPEASIAYFAPNDQAHTSRRGAEAVASLVATELVASKHPLSAWLLP
jgi:lysophospholipase L1-like esterase